MRDPGASGCYVVTVWHDRHTVFRKRGIEPEFEAPGVAQNPSLYNATQLALRSWSFST